MILIVATPAEYAVIEAALKKLDVPQRQVSIEVTIAEVTLTDELQTGIEWLFRGAAPSGRGSGGQFNTIDAVQSGRGSAAAACDRRRGRTRGGGGVQLPHQQHQLPRRACRRRCICSTPTAAPR